MVYVAASAQPPFDRSFLRHGSAWSAASSGGVWDIPAASFSRRARASVIGLAAYPEAAESGEEGDHDHPANEFARPRTANP